MPLTRIRQTAIGNDTITTAKLDDTSGGFTLPGVQYVRVPVGTTAQRPTGASGYLRFNTNLGILEQWNTTINSWQAIDSPPIITSVAYAGSTTAADPAGGETITLTGSNFQTGATVTIGGTSATSVTVVSTTSITFTTPAKTAGDYDVVVTNSNGLSATSTNGISYNGVPSFTTAAGNVGSITEDVAMSTITIVAAEPDGGTLAYSITSGALPTGVSMSSAGAITGTPNVNPSADTTFNFTVTATDDENQTNSRAFNLIVLRPIFAYNIPNSLRFDGTSSYLMRTENSAPTSTTQTTFSAWIKRGDVGQEHIWTAYNSNVAGYIYFDSNDKIVVYLDKSSAGSDELNVTTDARFRDPTAWYHILVKYDVGQAANSDKVKIYVNGNPQSATYSQTGSAVDAHRLLSSGTVNRIGQSFNGSSWFAGYMAELYIIDGEVKEPTDFAETFNGVWAPKAYSGSYGTNGFKLTFANSSDLGNDVSGNNNDYTPNNLTVSDHVIDSPTNNFATLNPLTKGSYNTLNEGALRLASVYASDLSGVAGTQFFSSGKWYWEVRVNGIGTYPYVGIATPQRAHSSQGIYYTVAWNASGSNQTNSSDLGTITGVNVGSFANGDIIMLALDVDARKLWWGENGTWANSGDPAAGTGEVASWTVDEDVSPVIMGYSGQGVGTIMNFGQDSTFAGNETVASNADSNGLGQFQYSPPTNFLAMTSKNLPESTINTTQDDRPEDYMGVTLWTADVSNPTAGQKSINVGFQPDLVWSTDRSAGEHIYLIDSVRGDGDGSKLLRLPGTNAEGGDAVGSTSAYYDFTSTGFDIIDSDSGTGEVYYNSRNYVGWTWKAGGAPTASNVATSGAMTANSVSLNGTLQSSYTPDASVTQYPTKMSINTKAGFSIVGWTGNGSAGTWLPHGLSSTPEMMMLRGRDARVWSVYHKDLTSAGYYLQLNSSNGESADNAMFNSVAPNSVRFVVGSYNVVTNVDYIGYFWHSVPGFSKIGSYAGKGNTDGPVIPLGFRPAFILIKSTGAGTSWCIYDNKRLGYNVDNNLQRIAAAAEQTDDDIDFLSNGFKIRRNSTNFNSGTLLYMAFAENPFKYATAR